MRNHTLQKVFLGISLYLIGTAFSQSNHLYYHQNPSPVSSGEIIEISQLIFSEDEIIKGMLFFRDKGEISFQEIEMIYTSGKWVGTIPKHRVTTEGLEYVTILTTQEGGRIALPFIDDPFDNPLFIQVKPKDIAKNNNLTSRSSEHLGGDYEDADVLILSPEDGAINRPDEIVISASLFNAPNVDQTNFKIFIDDKDYTDQTVIFGDVLSLVPDQDMDVGYHSIRLLFKTSYGLDVVPIRWSFNVSKGMVNSSESLTYKGSFVGRRSSNTASSISIDEEQYSGKFDAELSWIKAKYSFRKTSRESKLSQPLNRRSLTLQITDYLKIENGDVYPSISPFILDGKRVDGRHINADFNYGFEFDGFNFFGRDLLAFGMNGTIEFQTVSGTLSREVQYQKGIDRAYELITDNVQYDEFGNRVYIFDRNGYTFPRNINAARLAFSLNNKFKGSIHFLKAKDDYEKIKKNAPDNSLFTVDSSVTGDSVTNYYTLAQFLDSLTNGDTVKIRPKNWGNGRPEENLAIGFDFEGAMDNRKILFQMGWNMSLTNNNIWAGTANKDSLDLMMDTLVDGKLLDIPIDEIGDLIESYENIFTVHPLYMSPIIPIDPIVQKESPIRAILNMPASAYYLRLKGSYSFNNILIEYRQLGPGYKSFGNPYLTNNIRQLTVNDRLSALGRRLMFVVGYKYRDNKLSDLVANPIATRTVSFNTTLVPGPGAPSIIMNLQSIGRTNGIDSIDTDQYGNYLGDSRENSQALNIMASVNVPGNFEKFTTTTSINVNSITYKDNLSSVRNKDFFFQKSETQTMSITLSTRFQIPLKTSTTFNKTKIIIPYLDPNNIPSKQENSWTSFSTSAQYSLFKNKLRFRAGVDFMTNGKTDNTGTQLYGGKFGGDWDIINRLTLSFSSSIRMNSSNSEWNVNSSGFNTTLGYRF